MTAALSTSTTPSPTGSRLPLSRHSPTAGGTAANSMTSRHKTAVSLSVSSSNLSTTTFFSFPVPVVTSSTYFYVFNHVSHFDVYPRWADGVHADDLSYAFGAPVAAAMEAVGQSANEIDPFTSVYSGVDRSMSETMMRYWSNFIWSGLVSFQNVEDFCRWIKFV